MSATLERLSAAGLAHIHPALAARRSPRAIDAEAPVGPAAVDRLLQAARWAPSSGNAQPWRYVVLDARTPGQLDAARDLLNTGNAWARAAPVLLLSAAARRFPAWHPLAGEENPTALHDLGAASHAVAVQGAADGLVVHQMAGFDHAGVRSLLQLPEHWDPVALIAVGHPGDPALLPQPHRDRESAPRERQPAHDFTYLGDASTPLDREATMVHAASGPALQDITPGLELPPVVRGPMSTAHIMRWSAAIENWHRIHYDRPFAVSHDGLPDVLVNGSWKQHVLVQLVSDWLGPTGRLAEISFAFRAMNVPGDVLTAWGQVEDVREEDGHGVVTMSIGISDQNGKETTPGTAVGLVPLKAGDARPQLPLPEKEHANV
jgi:nitroreductase/acyl dehydratase